MNYPTELQQKMAAAGSIGLGHVAGALSQQHDAINHQVPMRDEPPVGLSLQRLFERLGQLQAETDLLTDRLAPVSRPELKGTGEGSTRAPSECAVVDMIDQAAERAERAICQLRAARDRLCI